MKGEYKMLSFEQMINILAKYPLTKHSYRDGRLNYKYNKKVVVGYLSQTGNCYVWGKDLVNSNNTYQVDKHGWVKDVAFMTEEEVKKLLNTVIEKRKLKPKVSA